MSEGIGILIVTRYGKHQAGEHRKYRHECQHHGNITQ